MATTQSDSRKAYVRLAKSEELEPICQIMFRAFTDDPVFNYFGSVKDAEANKTDTRVKRDLFRFTRFLPHLCKCLGGRITVAILPGEDGNEAIGAAAMWLPPNRRPALWKVITVIRAGIIGVISGWGRRGLKRIDSDYLNGCHKSIVRGFKTKGVKESPDNSWYLLMVGTDTDHQGKGLLSLLIREAYTYAPTSIFTLEASSPKSRDRYAHLGFELLEELRFGTGKVDNLGYSASAESAVGVPVAVMAKWPAEGRPGRTEA